jgi:hypothetical protein
LEYALRYAALGWPVFPCEGKKPDGLLAPHGFKDATRDEARIRKWWGGKPDANLGVPCGQASGFWVLDVDPRNGGNASLDNLVGTYGALPDTLIQSTGGGGQHFLFAHDAEVVKGKLGEGLDVKRDGGYIIVEPSVTTGAYGFLDWDVFEGPPAIAPAPGWLLQLVRAKPVPKEADAAEPWNADIGKLRSALAVIDADDYIEWITIGAALHHSSSGHPDGLAMWIEWSRKSAKFEDGACEKRWEGLGRFGGQGRATVATIYWRAQEQGWRAPRRREKPAGAAGSPPADALPPEAPQPGDDPRPSVRVKEGELPRVVEDADALLRMHRVDRIYQRAGRLVRVVRRSVPSVRNYRRPVGVLGLQEVDAPYLVAELTRIARWERFDKRADAWRRIDCPDRVANTLLAQHGRWTVPRLWGTLSAPTLRPDGTLLQSPGYDEATCTFYDPGDVRFPEVAEHPTREDAEAALALLMRVIKDFPFVDEWDRSVALAMMLTGLVRRSLPSAPLGAFTAPTMGSGKSLLADVVSILATGVSAPAMQYATTDEEAAKTALAVLSEGDPVVLIDNIERPLEGDWLCTALTSEFFRGRVLGRSETVSVPTTTLFLATGNQLVVRGDLRTRTLLCRIDAKMERPEERQFRRDLRADVTEHRPQLVAAGLTIMRAFACADIKPEDVVNAWGRFEGWSAMVRAPLVWLGVQDPCASLHELEQEDPARVEHLAVVSAWHRVFDRPVTVRAALEELENNLLVGGDEARAPWRALQAAILDIAADRSGHINAKRLGNWLRYRQDRPVGGLRFTRKRETRDGVVEWHVVPV